MKPILLMITAMMMLLSCSSRKPLIQKEFVQVTDTTYVTKTVRDTVVILRRADTITITLPFSSLKKDTSITKENGKAKLAINITNGQISTTCICDSLKAKVKQYETTINTLKTRVEKTQTPIITNELTNFQRIFYNIGLIITLLLAGAGILKFITSRISHG